MARWILSHISLALLFVFFGAQSHAQMPFAFLANRPNLTKTYVISTHDLNDADSYNFAGVSLGTPSAYRYILVGISSRSASTSAAFTSVTVAGVTATILGQYNTGGTVVGFALLPLPTGATGTIAVTASATMVYMGVSVWSLGNLQSMKERSSASFTASSSVTIPAGGGAFCMTSNNNNARAFTGITTDYNSGVLNESGAPHRMFAAASDLSTSLSTLSVALTGTASAPATYCTVLK